MTISSNYQNAPTIPQRPGAAAVKAGEEWIPQNGTDCCFDVTDSVLGYCADPKSPSEPCCTGANTVQAGGGGGAFCIDPGTTGAGCVGADTAQASGDFPPDCCFGADTAQANTSDFPPDCCFGADTARSSEGFLFAV